MSLSNEIAKSVVSALKKSLFHNMGTELSKQFNLNEKDVNDFIESYIDNNVLKKKKRAPTDYAIFKKQMHKHYQEKLKQQGALDGLDSKQRLKQVSTYVGERWGSLKKKPEEFQQFKQEAQKIKSQDTVSMPPPAPTNPIPSSKQTNPPKPTQINPPKPTQTNPPKKKTSKPNPIPKQFDGVLKDPEGNEINPSDFIANIKKKKIGEVRKIIKLNNIPVNTILKKTEIQEALKEFLSQYYHSTKEEVCEEEEDILSDTEEENWVEDMVNEMDHQDKMGKHPSSRYIETECGFSDDDEKEFEYQDEYEYDSWIVPDEE